MRGKETKPSRLEASNREHDRDSGTPTFDDTGQADPKDSKTSPTKIIEVRNDFETTPLGDNGAVTTS